MAIIRTTGIGNQNTVTSRNLPLSPRDNDCNDVKETDNTNNFDGLG